MVPLKTLATATSLYDVVDLFGFLVVTS